MLKFVISVSGSRLNVFKSIYVSLMFFLCLFSIFFILRFCIVLRIVSPFVHSCHFTIFVQVYRSLPPGGNPFAVNKYHIIYHLLAPGVKKNP
jgi:hypothetical protein